MIANYRQVKVKATVSIVCTPELTKTRERNCYAENEFVAGVAEGAGAGVALTGVNPPELTAVKPDEMAGRGSSGGVGTASPCRDAFNAVDALIAGESAAFAVGVPCAAFFIGECAGDGVKGPPCSCSSIWCTPGFATLRYSSYGCNHF